MHSQETETGHRLLTHTRSPGEGRTQWFPCRSMTKQDLEAEQGGLKATGAACAKALRLESTMQLLGMGKGG